MGGSKGRNLWLVRLLGSIECIFWVLDGIVILFFLSLGNFLEEEV